MVSVTMQRAAAKRYIGDGVYAEIDNERGTMTVTTSDGIRTTNEIIFEDDVWLALVAYRARFIDARRAANTEDG